MCRQVRRCIQARESGIFLIDFERWMVGNLQELCQVTNATWPQNAIEWKDKLSRGRLMLIYWFSRDVFSFSHHFFFFIAKTSKDSNFCSGSFRRVGWSDVPLRQWFMKDQSFMWLPADPANPEVLGVIHLVSVWSQVKHGDKNRSDDSKVQKWQKLKNTVCETQWNTEPDWLEKSLAGLHFPEWWMLVVYRLVLKSYFPLRNQNPKISWRTHRQKKLLVHSNELAE